MAGRIQGCIDRLRYTLPEVFDESKRKRPAPSEPTDGLSEAKRQRLDAQVPPVEQLPVQPPPPPPPPPPLPAGPVSYAQLFTLTHEQGLKSFDVNVIPFSIIQSIVVPLLSSIDKGKMDHALNVSCHQFPVIKCCRHSMGATTETYTRAQGWSHGCCNICIAILCTQHEADQTFSKDRSRQIPRSIQTSAYRCPRRSKSGDGGCCWSDGRRR